MIQKNTDFNLKVVVAILLTKSHFYTEQEKTDYARSLRAVLHDLNRIHLELAYLNPKISAVIPWESNEPGADIDIVQLIRHVRNRLKVLPAEPVEVDYSMKLMQVAVN